MELKKVYEIASAESLTFDKEEVDEFFDSKAWLAIQQMLCRSVVNIVQTLSNPKTTAEEIKQLQFLLIATNEMIDIESRVRAAIHDKQIDEETYSQLKELASNLLPKGEK